MFQSFVQYFLFSLFSLSVGLSAAFFYDNYGIGQVNAGQSITLEGTMLLNYSQIRDLTSQDTSLSLLTSSLRAELIRYLWNQGFSNFEQMPYDTQGNGILQRV